MTQVQIKTSPNPTELLFQFYREPRHEAGIQGVKVYMVELERETTF